MCIHNVFGNLWAIPNQTPEGTEGKSNIDSRSCLCLRSLYIPHSLLKIQFNKAIEQWVNRLSLSITTRSVQCDAVPNHKFLNGEMGINGTPSPITNSAETQIAQQRETAAALGLLLNK